MPGSMPQWIGLARHIPAFFTTRSAARRIWRHDGDISATHTNLGPPAGRVDLVVPATRLDHLVDCVEVYRLLVHSRPLVELGPCARKP
jgi:hypothetical protein